MAAKSNHWRKPVARRVLAFLEIPTASAVGVKDRGAVGIPTIP